MSVVNQVIDKASAVLHGAHADILLILIALGVHALVFGRYRISIGGSSSDSKSRPPAPKGSSAANAKGKQSAAAKAQSAAERLPEQEVSAAGNSAQQEAFLQMLAAEEPLTECFGVFRSLAQKTPTIYNGLIEACIKCNDLCAAEELTLEAAKARLANTATCKLVPKAYLQNGDTRRARATVEALCSAGARPAAATFNELVEAAGRDWALMVDLRRLGLKPNNSTCTLALKAAQKSGKVPDLERAVAILEDLEEHISEANLSLVCDTCVQMKCREHLVAQLRKHWGASKVPAKSSYTFCSILRAYGFAKDMRGLRATWLEMKSRGAACTSVALGCMVEALASNGDCDAGHKVILESLRDPQLQPLVNAVMYCSLLKGFSHQKCFDRVWVLYEEMKGQRLQFSVVTYNTLIDACSRSKDMTRIPAILKEMTAAQIEPNTITYSAIIKGYCISPNNRVNQAFDLLEEMKGTKYRPDEITYNTLLEGCARFGMWDRGLATLQEMERVKVPLSNFTLGVLAKLANRSKRPGKAFELTDQLSKKYGIQLNVHVFNNLVATCTQHDNLPKGLEVLQRMLCERVRPDARTYMLLLQAAVNAKSAADAAGLLRAAGGLPGAHAAAEGHAQLAQPKEGLAMDVVSEAIEGIAGLCKDEALAMELLRDARNSRGLPLDRRRLMRSACKTTRNPAQELGA